MSKPIGPMDNRIVEIPEPNPYRHRDTETVTITLERYEAMKRDHEVVKVVDESKHLRDQVKDQAKRIESLLEDVTTYERYLAVLAGVLGDDNYLHIPGIQNFATQKDFIVHVMQIAAEMIGHNIDADDDGISLREDDIFDAVARHREKSDDILPL